MADYSQWLDELAKREGASVEQSDLLALQGKNPEDVQGHMRKLEEQYAKRGASTAHRTQDSQSGAYADVGADPRSEQSGAASQNLVSSGAVTAAVPNATPAQSWNAAPAADPYPAWYQGMMQQQAAQQAAAQAETKAKSDALYGTLSTRATQGLAVNADDPIIKGQVDAYGAAGERSRRNYLSDVAERGGPYQNMRGEQRMTAEKLGQGTSAFQSELLGRELGSRRDEIAQALSMQGSILSGDQSRNLQSQLAAMDQAIKEAGVGMQGRGLDLQRDLGFGGLDLQRELGMGGLDLQRQLGMGGLDLQRMLGLGGQDLTRRGQDLSQDQFMRELALREWDMGDDSDFRWASL